MSTPLYGFGYSGELLTREQLLAKRTVARMDPEFRRRVLAMMEASPVTTAPDGRRHYSVTLGESWRDTSNQEREFYRRHYLNPNGSLLYKGQRYSLRAGMSPLAPPGASYHESSDLEDESLAADLFGNNAWANANCHRFGLMNFRATGSKPEQWHHQPVEIPTARRSYRPSNLPVWNLPGSPLPAPVPPAPVPPAPVPPAPLTTSLLNASTTGDPMYVIANKDNPSDTTRYAWNGLVKRRIRDEQEFNVLRFLGFLVPNATLDNPILLTQDELNSYPTI